MADDRFIESYGDPLNHITGRDLMDRLEKAGIVDPRIFEVVKDLPPFEELPNFIVPISREAMKEQSVGIKEKIAPLLSQGSWLGHDKLSDQEFITGDPPVKAMQEILEKAQKLLTFLLGNARIPLGEPVTVRFSGDDLTMINITFLL